MIPQRLLRGESAIGWLEASSMRSPVLYGKYLLLERISVGGMAEVFKARRSGQRV